MKLKKEFIAHITGEEAILVPSGKAKFSGVVRGNKTLGAILELLKDEISGEELLQAMKARFEAPEGIIERDLEKALAELRSIGALDE